MDLDRIIFLLHLCFAFSVSVILKRSALLPLVRTLTFTLSSLTSHCPVVQTVTVPPRRARSTFPIGQHDGASRFCASVFFLPPSLVAGRPDVLTSLGYLSVDLYFIVAVRRSLAHHEIHCINFTTLPCCLLSRRHSGLILLKA